MAPGVLCRSNVLPQNLCVFSFFNFNTLFLVVPMPLLQQGSRSWLEMLELHCHQIIQPRKFLNKAYYEVLLFSCIEKPSSTSYV